MCKVRGHARRTLWLLEWKESHSTLGQANRKQTGEEVKRNILDEWNRNNRNVRMGRRKLPKIRWDEEAPLLKAKNNPA